MHHDQILYRWRIINKVVYCLNASGQLTSGETSLRKTSNKIMHNIHEFITAACVSVQFTVCVRERTPIIIALHRYTDTQTSYL